MISVPQVACALLVLWPIYRLARRFLAWSPLDDIPGLKSDSLLIGNLAKMFDRNSWKTHREVEDQYGGIMKFYGVFGERQLYVSDPKALHHIFIKEYESYVEPEFFYINNTLHFGDGIFSHSGEMHRKYRRLLSPMFSTSNLREQTPTFFEITNQVKSTWLAKLSAASKKTQEFEVVNWTTRLALELIGQAGLGYSFDSLTGEDEGSRYANAVKGLFPTEAPYLPAAVYLLPLVHDLFSLSMWRKIINTIPWKKLHDVRDIVDTMHEYAVKILESAKKKANGEGEVKDSHGKGKDIITRLIKANMSASEKERITDEQVMGNMTGMIFAAMDTTSAAIARTLHTLASHPAAQDRLRAELVAAFGDNEELSYDEVNELPYLDAVCRETMRVYSPVTIVPRVTAKATSLPLHTPIPTTTGQLVSSIPIPAGTSLYISILASNTNPAIWGNDGREWKPERWLNAGGVDEQVEGDEKSAAAGSALPESVKKAGIPGVYPHLMTFLAGPHSCLGFTFAQLEMKVVLAVLIKNFKFELSPIDKRIIWETPGISSPLIVEENGEKKPGLMMKVSIA